MEIYFGTGNGWSRMGFIGQSASSHIESYTGQDKQKLVRDSRNAEECSGLCRARKNVGGGVSFPRLAGEKTAI